MNNNAMQGTVKRKVADKGFGFILGSDNQEYFFHQSEVGGRNGFDGLSEGQQVKFTPETSPKGPRAGSIIPQ